MSINFKEMAEIAKIRHTKDPQILTEIVKRGINNPISQWAVSNSNCPPEMLSEVLRKGKNNLVSRFAARNRNCHKEILAEVLRREKDDDVSLNASRNPNCPDEAKIKWMQITGRIEKENPKKHIIEYEKITEDDFQDLKDLL